jgi:benzoyl-CoA 2,3-dioxygenase component B
MLQKYLNLWYTLSLDLFGGEISSNAASYFAAGLKGRAKEATYADHVALNDVYRMQVLKDGRVSEEEVPLRNAMNEVLRDEYVEDCQRGVDRWNKRLAEAGIKFEFRLPSRRFHRHIGMYANMPFDPDGRLLPQSDYEAKKSQWLPTDEDRAYVKSLQQQVVEPGKIANWIAKPKAGIKGLPFEYEYVKLN